MIEFLEFSAGDAWYERVLPLRNGVLREPLGLRFSDADREAERSQWHFALAEDAAPVACVIAAPLVTLPPTPSGPVRCKLRQMAVSPSRRGEGLGRFLLECLEATLRCRGVVELTLHARADAVGFYERLNYQSVGEGFIEVTIPHQAMVKRLEG